MAKSPFNSYKKGRQQHKRYFPAFREASGVCFVDLPTQRNFGVPDRRAHYCLWSACFDIRYFSRLLTVTSHHAPSTKFAVPGIRRGRKGRDWVPDVLYPAYTKYSSERFFCMGSFLWQSWIMSSEVAEVDDNTTKHQVNRQEVKQKTSPLSQRLQVSWVDLVFLMCAFLESWICQFDFIYGYGLI